ncbi:MAG: hypothetical protein ACK5Y6_04235 [Pseudomonadota bacterium]|jgi:hypothetical protein
MPTPTDNESGESQTTEQRRDTLVLSIADTCFEMFSLQELKRPIAILHEIALSFPEATRSEIQDAINIAISWRRALRNASGWIN